MRPIISQTNKNAAPMKMVCGIVLRKLSPKYSETRFGTINPKNGIIPTVKTTVVEIIATIIIRYLIHAIA